MSEHTPAGAVTRCLNHPIGPLGHTGNISIAACPNPDCDGGWVPVDTRTECGYARAPWAAVVCPGDTVLTPQNKETEVVAVFDEGRVYIRIPDSPTFYTTRQCFDLRLVLPLDTPYRRAAGLVPPT